MRIVEASEGDLPHVLRLLKELDHEAELVYEDALKVWQRMKSYPFYKVFIAVEQGKEEIVGTFSLLIGDNLGHGSTPFAIVENVVVDPRWQGQGVGKRMMIEAMNIARSHGCYKLMLSSNLKRTEAHGFYEQIGFRKHGVSYCVELVESVFEN